MSLNSEPELDVGLELDTLDPDISLSEEMDLDKEVTQRLLDGQEPSSYTELSSTRGSKGGSRVGILDIDQETSGSAQHNPFADPEVAERYTSLYEKAQYECRHVFDPTLTWTREEERAIIRKIDWKVCLWAVCYTHLRIDAEADTVSKVRDVLRPPSRSREFDPGCFR
jgi:hypothetical protein